MYKKLCVISACFLIGCTSAEFEDIQQGSAVYELPGSNRIYSSARTGGKVIVKGTIQSIVPLDSAELVINGGKMNLGDLKQHRNGNGSGTNFVFESELEINTSSWITLQTYSIKPIHPVDDDYVQATTNPIWITVADEPVRCAASAQYFIDWIDKLTTMAEGHPGWRSDKEKAHVLAQFSEARSVIERLLAEAQELDR